MEHGRPSAAAAGDGTATASGRDSSPAGELADLYFLTGADGERLLLSRAPSASGPISAEQLRRQDLRRIWCAVLSVRDGTSYRVGPGDGRYGLVAALLTVGTGCVASAQWAVDDEAGRALVTDGLARARATVPAQAFADATAEHRGTGAPVRDWTAILRIGADTHRWEAA
jgi:hypothetical protein